ncbi:ATP-binding cassette domain-containing protein, partial [Acinetobacter baumannii]
LSVLDKVGLAKRAEVAAGELSYAEQRALELAVTIAADASVILLDEPTAGMSRAESAAMVALIREVTVGKTLLMVEHDMQVVFGLADRIAVMDNGRVIACDSAERIRA